MFLWWLQDKGESPRKKVQEDVSPLKQLGFSGAMEDSTCATREESKTFFNLPFGLWWGNPGVSDEQLQEKEYEEISRLESVLGENMLSRRSSVSRSGFSKYQEFETKRQSGERVRQESEVLRRRRDELRSQHQSAGYGRAQTARVQRAAAAERVRMLQSQNLERRKQQASDLRGLKMSAESERDKWLHEVSKVAHADGREQHHRILQRSRDDTLAERRAGAERVRREREQRLMEEKQAASDALLERRLRVDQVRDETRSEIAAAAADLFYAGRLRAADDVRSAIAGWREEKEERTNRFVQTARARYVAHKQQPREVESRLEFHSSRKASADQMRVSLAHLEARDRMQKLSTELERRDQHDSRYEEKFVDRDEAALVEESMYAALSSPLAARTAPSRPRPRLELKPRSTQQPTTGAPTTAHEAQDTEESAEGSTREAVPKEPKLAQPPGRQRWKPHFNGSGWFSFRQS